MQILLGADPELFLKRGDTFVSAEDARGPLIPGTKREPFEVRGGAIQVDGVAAEFNINPAKDFKEFYGNMKSVIGGLRDRIKKIDPELKLTAVPTATFDQRYFDSLPEHTKELGCEPDFSAYTGEANPRPGTDKPFRTGSGHVHIGWTNGKDFTSKSHMIDCCLVAKELDKGLHYASLTWDKDKKRQQLYGKPGSFRPKSYGMEYRPLSNAWLRDPELIRAVYLITMGTIRSLDSGKHDFDHDFSKDYGKSRLEKVLNHYAGYTYDL